MRFRSSVLRCFDDPEHCDVCRFIDGNRSIAVMAKVIELLDAELADSEEYNRELVKGLVDAIDS